MKASTVYCGGCACGVVRYECTEPPSESGWCHCRICQKTTAAPALVFASFPIAAFRYVQGSPNIFRSSEHGSREFCCQCGTQIAYRQLHAARYVDVNAGSLDDPESVSPDHHIWYSRRIGWFDVGDRFPRYPEGRD